MTKFITLITLALLSLTVTAGDNSCGAGKSSGNLYNVNVYTNMPAKSFIVDFYEKDFKAVTIKICDLSGDTKVEYDLGDVKSGSYAEMFIPKGITQENMVITITSEGRSLVKKTDAYATL